MVMKHAQLKAFHAVAKHGGFTNAAKNLGLTQPAITHQVQTLERNYGVRLFERRGRRVDLTQDGVFLLSIVKRYFSLEDAAHDFLTSIDHVKKRKLRIASDTAPKIYPLTEKFRATHPLTEISILICDAHQVERYLLDHKVDIAFTGTATAEPLLEYVKIGEEDITATVPIHSPIDENSPISLADLSDHKILVREDSRGMDHLIKDLTDLACIPRENLVGFESWSLIQEAIAHDQGISFLSKRDIGHDKRLKSIPIKNCPLKRYDYLAFHTELRDAPLVSSFRKIHSTEGLED